MPKVLQVSHYWFFGYGPEINERIVDEMGLEVFQSFKAFLRDYRLVFSCPSPLRPKVGTPDLVASSGCAVEGMLYEIDDGGLSVLDSRFGVGRMIYRRKSIDVIAEDGCMVSAAVYVATRNQVGLLPSKKDLDALVEGAGNRGFSRAYVEELASMDAWEE